MYAKVLVSIKILLIYCMNNCLTYKVCATCEIILKKLMSEIFLVVVKCIPYMVGVCYLL